MSKLHEILEDQLAEAKAKAGQTVVRKLYKGLRIELLSTTGQIALTITRDDKFPSLEEWETVTRHFPYQVPKVIPAPEQKGSRYTISARFASQSIMQMKF